MSTLQLHPVSSTTHHVSACSHHVSTCSHQADFASAPWDEGDYYSIGGSGRVVSDRAVSIRSGLEARGVRLIVSPSDDVSEAQRAMEGATVGVACGGATSTEGKDRQTLA